MLTQSDIDSLLGLPTSKPKTSTGPAGAKPLVVARAKLELSAVVDTYQEQHCLACGGTEYLHVGRMVEEIGPLLRVLRKPRNGDSSSLAGLTYKREFISCDVPMCFKCSSTYAFAQEAVDLLANPPKQLALAL